jgi:riboflavin synthase
MFTGLVETVGTVLAARRAGEGLRLQVDLGPAAEGVRVGDSIALSGACLTVASLQGAAATFDAVGETVARTTLGSWQAGTRVNIERSLRPADRLGGHFVAGHVDATGRVIENREGSGGWWLRVEVPEALLPEIAPKGSIAIDGVSLTVAEVAGAVVGIALIPTTLQATTLGQRVPGDQVNVETDLLAKYVQRAMAAGQPAPDDKRLLDALGRAGFMG